ncbi:MAG: hypothetical protein PHI73_04390 [Patescibacteria group bacterium]|nr:hypothetical protein [Patescibacteria group bacterium]
MTTSSLSRSILSELAYFDIFEHPLTLMEIWRFNSQPKVTLAEVIEATQNDDWLKEKIDQKWGFYFLKGRQHTVELRLKRYREAEAKYQKALKFARRLSAFPFIRMIGVCNSLAYSNSRLAGDIDFLIVAEPRRIWTARFYAAGCLKLLGERPVGQETKDKICLTFFISPEGFDLRPIKISSPDIYLAHWVKQIVPIYDPRRLYQQFMKANSWVDESFPNGYPVIVPPARKINRSFFNKLGQKVFETIHSSWLGDWLERYFEKIQRRRLPDQLQRLANRDSRVILSKQMLKFHDNDRREKYQNLWLQKLKTLGL